jgi:hypothetical protein
MDKPDKIDWEKFRASTSSRISKEEVLLVSELHAKYFNHKVKVPCSCSPKTLQGYINDLNKLYDNQKNT